MKSSKKFLTRVLTAALALSMVAGMGIFAAAADVDEEQDVLIAPEDGSGISKLAALKERIGTVAESVYERFSQTKAAQLIEIAQKMSAAQQILASAYSQEAEMKTALSQQTVEILEEAQKLAAEAESEEEAAQIMADAQAQADQLVEEGLAQIDQMIAEAEAASEALMTEANEQLDAIKTEVSQKVYERFSQSKLGQLVEIAQKIAASQKILKDAYSEAVDIQNNAAQQAAEIIEAAYQAAEEEEDEEAAAQMIADAEAQADELVNEAVAQAEQMIADAEAVSAALLEEATAQLEEIKAETQGKVAEIAQQLSQAAEQAKAQIREVVSRAIDAVVRRTARYKMVTDGDYMYSIEYSLRGVSAAFIGYFGEEEEITVPAYINDIPVECIMFANNGVKAITIPATIGPLDAVSFSGAENLENIYVDDDNPYYQSIDGAVFDKSGLVLIAVPKAKEFNAPEGTLFFGSDCYAYSRMSEIKLPSTLLSIGDYAFENCDSLTSIDIPDGVQAIGNEAFKDCVNFGTAHIPASVETIGDFVFSGCRGDLLIELDTIDCQGYIYARMYDIPVKCPLVVALGLEAEFVEAGEYMAVDRGATVTVSGQAEGNPDGDYQYAFYYRKEGDTKWTCKQSFKANDSVAITFRNAGLYEICVKAKDSTGAVAKMYDKLLVKETFENTSEISAETIKAGEKVTVNCSATSDNVEFAVFFRQKDKTKWTKKQDFSDNTEVTITPAAATDYEICVKAKNLDDGTVTKKYFDVKVTE